MQDRRLVHLEKDMGLKIGDPHGVRITVEEHAVFLPLFAGYDDFALKQGEYHTEFDEKLGNVPQLSRDLLVGKECSQHQGTGKDRGPGKKADDGCNDSYGPTSEVLPVEYGVDEIELREKGIGRSQRRRTTRMMAASAINARAIRRSALATSKTDPKIYRIAGTESSRPHRLPVFGPSLMRFAANMNETPLSSRAVRPSEARTAAARSLVGLISRTAKWASTLSHPMIQ
jgi:hypothetical protein